MGQLGEAAPGGPFDLQDQFRAIVTLLGVGTEERVAAIDEGRGLPQQKTGVADGVGGPLVEERGVVQRERDRRVQFDAGLRGSERRGDVVDARFHQAGLAGPGRARLGAVAPRGDIFLVSMIATAGLPAGVGVGDAVQGDGLIEILLAIRTAARLGEHELCADDSPAHAAEVEAEQRPSVLAPTAGAVEDGEFGGAAKAEVLRILRRAIIRGEIGVLRPVVAADALLERDGHEARGFSSATRPRGRKRAQQENQQEEGLHNVHEGYSSSLRLVARSLA